MEISVIQIGIAIAIVLVCGAIAVCKVIDAKAEANKVSFKYITERLKDLEEIQKNGSLGLLIPGIEETSKFSKKSLTYQEAIFTEQLLSRITIIRLIYSEAKSEFDSLHPRTSKVKVEVLNNKVWDCNRHFLNAIDTAAYWHLQGLISFPAYKEHFLRATVDVYDDIDIAKNWSNIREIEKKYGHLIRGNEEGQ